MNLSFTQSLINLFKLKIHDHSTLNEIFLNEITKFMNKPNQLGHSRRLISKLLGSIRSMLLIMKDSDIDFLKNLSYDSFLISFRNK